jgi:hypothetical protein
MLLEYKENLSFIDAFQDFAINQALSFPTNDYSHALMLEVAAENFV